MIFYSSLVDNLMTAVFVKLTMYVCNKFLVFLQPKYRCMYLKIVIATLFCDFLLLRINEEIIAKTCYNFSSRWARVFFFTRQRNSVMFLRNASAQCCSDLFHTASFVMHPHFLTRPRNNVHRIISIQCQYACSVNFSTLLAGCH